MGRYLLLRLLLSAPALFGVEVILPANLRPGAYSTMARGSVSFRAMRGHFTIVCAGVALASLCAMGALAQAAPANIDYKHGYAFLSEPKYPADFTHFDYVNPDAVKGGRMRNPAMGSWDNFNNMSIPSGRMAPGLSVEQPHVNLVHDSLMSKAADEPATMYGRLAEAIAVAEDGAYIAFKLRNNGRWHDGQPITIEDVRFSFEIYMTKASPTISEPLAPISAIKVVGPREILFEIHEHLRGDPYLPFRIGLKPILAKHYWESRDVKKTSIEAPLGSGPYKVKKFRIGRSVTFARVKDYWGADIPVMRGRYNFDELKWDFFRDDQVQTESLKGDVIDVHIENIPRLWNTAYDFPPAHAGVFSQQFLPIERPWGLWWPVFWNLDQPRFQDIRVREALWLMSDVPWLMWINYGFYTTSESFFHGSEFASSGLPDKRELKYLEPIAHLIPERVFTEAYRQPPNGGKGWHRDNILRAMELLKEAGWVVEDGRLVHSETREPFHIRFVAVSPALAQAWIPYMQNLKRLGITSTAKSPEISNWLFRQQSGDFDGGSVPFSPDFTPTQLIANTFSSATADLKYSNNLTNMRDPAIDALIESIKRASNWDDYVAAIRAWDRVMQWNFYYAVRFSKTQIGLVHWERYGWPEPDAPLTRAAHLDTWWWDEEKAQKLADYRAGQR